MGKYVSFKVGDNYLYYTSQCFIECFHVHASNSKKLLEKGSAKFWVDDHGNSKVVNKGRLKDYQVTEIQNYIKEYYKDMYKVWVNAGGKPEYKKSL